MYDLLLDLIGVTPQENLPGFLFCVLILMWFIFNLFQMFYTFVKGK